MKRFFMTVIALFVVLFFTGLANAETVNLTWNANSEDDLAGYQLYQSGTSGGSYVQVGDNITLNMLADATGPQWTAEFEPGNYFLVLTAFNGEGMVSPFSEEVPLTVIEGDIDPDAPDAPTGLTVVQIFLNVVINR